MNSEFQSMQSLDSFNKSFDQRPEMENMQDADNSQIRVKVDKIS